MEEARARLEERWQVPPLAREEIDLEQAVGRVLAEEARAATDLPGYARSTVDGYAVRAQDTYGAGESVPVWLRVEQELAVGEEASRPLAPGACARVATGGMLPPEADAVVMLEYTAELAPGDLEVFRPVARGENMLGPDEDAARGEWLFGPGRRLRAVEVGSLAAAGITRLEVYRRPTLALVSSGDELVDADEPVKPGRVRDVNTYSLGARARALGAEISFARVVPDRPERIRETLEEGVSRAQLVVMTGGTSVGAGDHAARAMGGLKAGPGILVHGLALRPGKPTIIALSGSIPVFGLSGNPVSALITFELLVLPVLEKLAGAPFALRGTLWARLASNVPSVQGREDYLRVQLQRRGEDWIAEPFPGKAGLINTLAQAQGLVRIPCSREGLPAGHLVEVIPLD